MMHTRRTQRARRRAAVNTLNGGFTTDGDTGLALIRQMKTEEEMDLEHEMKRMIDNNEWQHPFGKNVYCAAASLLAGTFNPVMHRCSEYMQTDEPMWIPELYESHYGIICLYYSLVGVLSVEISFQFEQHDDDDILYTISSFCWASNILWSLGGVVCAFHVLWAIHATPIKERRQFINKNSFAFSAVYSLGSLNFVLVNVAVFTGVLGHARRQPGKNAFNVALGGLLLGFLMEGIFLYCAGLVTVQSMRPWKVAYNRLKDKESTAEKQNTEQKKSIGEATVSSSRLFHDDLDRRTTLPYIRKKSVHGDCFSDEYHKQSTAQLTDCEEEDENSEDFGVSINYRSASMEQSKALLSSFYKVGIPVDEAIKLEQAGLSLEELKDPNLDTMFIDRLLVDAHITVPGHRLAIMRVLKGKKLNYYGVPMDESQDGLDLQGMPRESIDGI